MCPRNDIGGRKNTLNPAISKEKLFNYYVYMLLTECLNIVKKMCAVRSLTINSKLSTSGWFI